MKFKAFVLVGLVSLAGLGCQTRIAAVPAPQNPRAQGPVALPATPDPDPAANQLPGGFRCEVAVRDLIYPTSIESDPAGNLYIAEGGYAYGDPFAPARILRVSPQGQLQVIAHDLAAPVTDLLWHQDHLYISQAARISRIESDGSIRDIVTGLPSYGDHPQGQLAAGPDGKLYVGVGTVTNSGVVGVDNFVFGWLSKHPQLHDVPPRDIEFRSSLFTTLNPFVLAGGKEPSLVRTAPFSAFGSGASGNRIVGQTKANGVILQFNPDGSDLRVHAWGLRNPFGIAWGRDGKFYAGDDGYDERGSRPIANAPDCLWNVVPNGWYGWPDYAAGLPVTDKRFRPKIGGNPEMLLKRHPPVEQPLIAFPAHTSPAKLTANWGKGFGDEGDLFMAVVGDNIPITGHGQPVSPRVLRISAPGRAPQYDTFMVSLQLRGDRFVTTENQPAPVPASTDPLEVRARNAGLRRPVDLQFSRDGQALYVVDFGQLLVLQTPLPMILPRPGTGVVWRIVPDGSPASQVLDISAAPGGSGSRR